MYDLLESRNTLYYMNRVMRKSDFYICKNKAADQLCGDRKADQRLCFRYTESKSLDLLPKSKFQDSSHLVWLYSLVCVGPGRKLGRRLSQDVAHYCFNILPSFY